MLRNNNHITTSPSPFGCLLMICWILSPPLWCFENWQSMLILFFVLLWANSAHLISKWSQCLVSAAQTKFEITYIKSGHTVPSLIFHYSLFLFDFLRVNVWSCVCPLELIDSNSNFLLLVKYGNWKWIFFDKHIWAPLELVFSYWMRFWKYFVFTDVKMRQKPNSQT